MPDSHQVTICIRRMLFEPCNYGLRLRETALCYKTNAGRICVLHMLRNRAKEYLFYMETSTMAGPATMVSSVAAVLHEVRTT
jgi:hypothetical protein